MNKQQVNIEFCWFTPEKSHGLEVPAYKTPLAAGMDIGADVTEPLEIPPGKIVLVPTGIGVALPAGYEMQVRPRSGLAVKHGITVVNSPGTIDADYRGEIKIALINLSKQLFTIERGDRIAQLVVAPVAHALLIEVKTLTKTDRGSGGFGHTGV
jgi:dUTP pyrophosphatase